MKALTGGTHCGEGTYRCTGRLPAWSSPSPTAVFTSRRRSHSARPSSLIPSSGKSRRLVKRDPEMNPTTTARHARTSPRSPVRRQPSPSGVSFSRNARQPNKTLPCHLPVRPVGPDLPARPRPRPGPGGGAPPSPSPSPAPSPRRPAPGRRPRWRPGAGGGPGRPRRRSGRRAWRSACRCAGWTRTRSRSRGARTWRTSSSVSSRASSGPPRRPTPTRGAPPRPSASCAPRSRP